jgi:polysaccharide export outer membrane protein
MRFQLLTFLFILLTACSVQAQEGYVFDPFEETRDNIPDFALTPPSNSLPVLPAKFREPLQDTEKKEPSRMEAYYAGRIVDELEQFGYDLFATEDVLNTALTPSGAVQDDFVLSIGDHLTVTLRGQVNSQKIYPITSDGLLTLDTLPPVPAAGRTISQVHAALKSQLSAQPNIDLYLSLDKVRQINVLVIGHVKKPGRQTLTVFHSLLDALSQAGGIEKDGSLRTIKLIRQGRTHVLDLYSLLVHGSDMVDMQLHDGDRLIVPPLGPTIAISGAVKRPGIYELRKTLSGMYHDPAKASETLNLQETLSLAGGVLAPGQNRFMHLALTQNGYEDVKTVSAPFTPLFRDGSILMVAPTDETRQGQIELAGHSRKNGIHPLSRNKTLSSLLNAETLGEKIYPLIGVIERYNHKTLKRSFLPFPLNLVINNQFDQRLQDGDVIHLFSQTQIHNLQENIHPSPLIPVALQEQGSTLLDSRQESYITDPVMADILREHSIHLKGSVRLPGAYPVAEGVTLEDVFSVSGGLTLEANRNRIEVTSNQLGEHSQEGGRSGTHRALVNLSQTHAQTVSLAPGDTVRVNQTVRKLKNDTVLLAGEVVQPGEYNLMPGDRLSILLARAGGLTPEAYPDGTIFSRARERKAEEQRYRAAARDMERALATALEKTEKDRPNTTQVAMVRSLASELKEVKTVGRITVEANPDKLLSYPELDILLEAGDKIYIPRRPYSVRVRGEVLSPSNLQFRSGKGPRDYLMEAGGLTHFADKDRVFVIYPDGSAQPLEVSNWNYKPIMIPPGSTIVVPRDPKPFDFMQTAKDITQILSNLAITGVVIDDIQDND